MIGTNPPAGTLAPRDSSVAIVVSKGPELIEVPTGLVGKTLEQAQAQLQALGFEVTSVDYLPGTGACAAVNPAAGSKVAKGTKVDAHVLSVDRRRRGSMARVTRSPIRSLILVTGSGGGPSLDHGGNHMRRPAHGATSRPGPPGPASGYGRALGRPGPAAESR